MIGRALRQQMRPDTAEAAAERIAEAARLAQVRAEVEARYPQITVANVHDALVFQETRIAELRADAKREFKPVVDKFQRTNVERRRIQAQDRKLRNR